MKKDRKVYIVLRPNGNPLRAYGTGLLAGLPCESLLMKRAGSRRSMITVALNGGPRFS